MIVAFSNPGVPAGTMVMPGPGHRVNGFQTVAQAVRLLFACRNDAVKSSFSHRWTRINTDEKDIFLKVIPTTKRYVCQAQRNNDYQLEKSVFIRGRTESFRPGEEC
jgi:hypothetical protein